ncbi:MAG: calcium-binding EGF-like domain-containing protein [Bacteroidia bacterium]|nr:calcium-binding EGF-like domain-containing protein [Bacteroidia bacterium]MDW8235962.1 calcium-binding EGF-like domain-containing protein [Bacteroidia bacterium]
MRYPVLSWGLSLFLVAVGLSGCEKGSCEGVVCMNGGTCRNGRCRCPVGFEGSRCEIKLTDQWIGQYQGEDRCIISGIIPPYSVSIQASPSYADLIEIERFANLTCEGAPVKVQAQVQSGTTAQIPRQSLCNLRFVMEGRATYNTSQRSIFIEYKIHDRQNNVQDSCSATLYKR